MDQHTYDLYSPDVNLQSLSVEQLV
jgi:hypothetical protein